MDEGISVPRTLLDPAGKEGFNVLEEVTPAYQYVIDFITEGPISFTQWILDYFEDMWLWLLWVYSNLTSVQLQQGKLILAVCLMVLVSCAVRAILHWYIRSKSKEPESSDKLGNLYGISVFDLAKRAYIRGNAAKVIILQERMAIDLNKALPGNGLTLFLCACVSGERNLVLHLMKKGADVTRTTAAGDNALYLATHGVIVSPQPDVRLINDLVNAGVPVNAQNKSGYTPLHRAASRGAGEVVETLLKNGADPKIPNHSGIYPIDIAINNGHEHVAPLLLIKLDENSVWDILEPHTPEHIKLGLQTTRRQPMIQSTKHKTKNFSRTSKK